MRKKGGMVRERLWGKKEPQKTTNKRVIDVLKIGGRVKGVQVTGLAQLVKDGIGACKSLRGFVRENPF